MDVGVPAPYRVLYVVVGGVPETTKTDVVHQGPPRDPLVFRNESNVGRTRKSGRRTGCSRVEETTRGR